MPAPHSRETLRMLTRQLVREASTIYHLREIDVIGAVRLNTHRSSRARKYIAQELRRRGFTYAEIGQAIGISICSAWAYCKELREPKTCAK